MQCLRAQNTSRTGLQAADLQDYKSWQHLPQEQKGKPLKTRLQSALHSAKPENRAQLHEHMVRVFGGTEEEKEIINHQLTSVYARNSNWQLRYYRDPKTKDIVAHVIVRPARARARRIRGLQTFE